MHFFFFFACLVSIIHSARAWDAVPFQPMCEEPYHNVCSSGVGLACECFESTLRDFIRSKGAIEVGTLKVECSQTEARQSTPLFETLKRTCEERCDCQLSELESLEDLSILSISGSDGVADAEMATQQDHGTESKPIQNYDGHAVAVLVNGQPIENLLQPAEPAEVAAQEEQGIEPMSTESGEERRVVILVDGQPIENLVLPAEVPVESVPEVPLEDHRNFGLVGGIARQMAVMILEAQAQGISAAQIAAAMDVEGAEGMSTNTDYDLMDSDSTADDDAEDDREEAEEHDLMELAETLIKLKYSQTPPPGDGSGGGASGLQGSQRGPPRFQARPVLPTETKKYSGRGRGRRGRGRGRRRNMCSVRCSHMDKCSILGEADICPTDFVCLADKKSAGQYFGIGWCTSLSVVTAFGATSMIIGRSLEGKQTNDLEEIACPCNESYVSRGCCDSRNGMTWESPGLNLLASLESL